eukprot:TRINITY_DN8630_c0_g1_i1.p1 TRINITY_DN8630_c0_g1~~TRINITY_DN8630_c0_g1_i1.p1  ORF type:complete len:671 (-),score=189.92 TRINITY_DN8630_c0_g1_i1:38-1888(-)
MDEELGDDDSLETRTNIIRGITGCAAPGQLLAILGPSGGGKTTLMDLLAFRKTTGDVGGKILANGQPVSKNIMRRISGYVMQEDVMMGALSVRETLLFSARLRLPQETSLAEVNSRVEAIMKELGLYHVRDSKIGTQFIRGISGGEKKRVAIGQELITDPSLLFLDEPTSGLDSSNAFNVVVHLKKLAKSGRTVVCTIHQPSSDLFELFDNVLLLTDSGDLAYFGPAKEAIPFFREQCGVQGGENTNPAEFLLKLVSGNHSPDEIHAEEDDEIISWVHKMKSTPKQVRGYAQTFKNSQIADNHVSEALVKCERSLKPLSFDSQYPTTFFRQFSVVAYRGMLTILRDPMQGVAMIVLAIFFAFLMGSLYYHIPANQSGIGDRGGALFFLAMNGAFSNLGSLELFLQEREIFIRERGNNMYRPSAYFIGRVLPDLPQRLIPGIIFGLIAYNLMGLRSGVDYFIQFLFIAFLNTMISYSLCLFVSSFAKNFALANLYAPMVIVLLMLPSGFLVNLKNIPWYWSWLKYISFFKYAFEAMMVNEFAGLPLHCNADEYKPPGCDPATTIFCICPVTNGNDVLGQLGMSTTTLWKNVYILIGMIGALLLAAFLCLKFLQKERR